MATNMLDADFGSESEDENFNPAPAVGSDDEGLEDSDAEEAVKPKANGATSVRNLDSSNERQSNGASAPIRGGDKRHHDAVEEDDEDGDADEIDGNLDGGPDDDEEEDEDDEDEEDAITVSVRQFA